MGIDKKIFIDLVKSIILNKEIKISNINLQLMVKYAKFHSLEYIIYLALEKQDINKELDIYQKFKKIAKINAYKCIVQDIEFDNVVNEFEKNKIKYLPLKGSILRKLYPDLQWRSMADLDILIPSNEMIKAGKILVDFGYSEDHLGGNHDSYVKKPYMNIELHRAMMNEVYNINNYYDDVWDRVKNVKEKNYMFALSDEDFFIFLITHAAKHFSGGGTGFRTIIDIYVFLENKKLDFEYIYQELGKMELVKFCKLLIGLSNYIFKDKIEDLIVEDLDLVLNYIIDCGTYGTIENSNVQDIKNEDLKKGKNDLVLRRLFPPFKMMKVRNPILKKLPFLLPFFWIGRLIKGLFSFKKHKRTYDIIQNVDINKYNEVLKIKEISGVKL